MGLFNLSAKQQAKYDSWSDEFHAHTVMQLDNGRNKPAYIKPFKPEMQRRYYVGWVKKLIPTVIMLRLRRKT